MQNLETEQVNGPYGAYCETTRRIVIISPFPGRLQGLVSELTEKCYDVLVFHHEREPLLASLHPDLMIVDRTVAPLETDGNEAPPPAGSVLYLVGDRSEAPPNAAYVHPWPGPLETAVERIQILVESREPVSSTELADMLAFRDIRMDLKKMTVHKGSQKIELTRMEYDLLKALLSADGVMSRQELMESIWGETYFGGSNSIDVHIKSLRKKLGDDPRNPGYILTVRGIGYRIAD